ncbi:MAG: class I SAM-dependent methyltransferase [Bacteroidales bacterium]|nr:class I SAM-dependent methyltransferase [Bacteroidales bacterium]
MKILESAPDRYDKGIDILSFGKLSQAYDRLISHIQKGQKVLDIGCGTGALTIKAARRDAKVTGIDINPQMLDIAKKHAEAFHLSDRIRFIEAGVAEMESMEAKSFDVVMSGLCFSELSEDEQAYALKQIKRILKDGGMLLLADETIAGNFFLRAINLPVKIVIKIITYVLTQTGTHAIRHLPEKVKKAGFKIESLRFNKMQDFIEVTAIKYKEAGS